MASFSFASANASITGHALEATQEDSVLEERAIHENTNDLEHQFESLIEAIKEITDR